MSMQVLGQRLALQHFHRDEPRPFVAVQIEHTHDAAMRQPLHIAKLADQSLYARLVAEQCTIQYLDRHLRVSRGSVHAMTIERAEDRGHAAAADRPLDEVAMAQD